MFLLFDVGGTKTRVAVSKDGRTLGESRIVSTVKTAEEGIQEIQKIAGELGGGETIKAIGGGIAGTFDRERTQLVYGTNISGWIGFPIKQELEKKFGGAKVYLENDTALAGLGEAHHGAGKGYEIVVYVTVSTGVGGAKIVDGRIVPAAYGFEPSYQIIGNEGGDLGSYISGRAMEEKYGRKPADISDPEMWEDTARLLAIGLNNSLVHWSPDILVLGGSMILKKPGISVERVRFHLEKVMKVFPVLPEIKLAELGDLGGLYGALAYLNQNRLP